MDIVGTSVLKGVSVRVVKEREALLDGFQRLKDNENYCL